MIDQRHKGQAGFSSSQFFKSSTHVDKKSLSLSVKIKTFTSWVIVPNHLAIRFLPTSMMEFSWLRSSAKECALNYNDAMNESSICNVIFRRVIPLFMKNTPLGFERLYLPFSFWSERVALRSMLEVSFRQLLTLQLSTSYRRSELWRQILQLGKGEYLRRDWISK